MGRMHTTYQASCICIHCPCILSEPTRTICECMSCLHNPAYSVWTICDKQTCSVNRSGVLAALEMWLDLIWSDGKGAPESHICYCSGDNDLVALVLSYAVFSPSLVPTLQLFTMYLCISNLLWFTSAQVLYLYCYSSYVYSFMSFLIVLQSFLSSLFYSSFNCQDPTKWCYYLQTHGSKICWLMPYLPASTSIVTKPDPQIHSYNLVTHQLKHLCHHPRSFLSIIIPRHGQVTLLFIIIILSNSIHSTLVYSYCCLVYFSPVWTSTQLLPEFCLYLVSWVYPG